ncbi:heterokaryon incompatibility protein-domain-containing protein [Hypoxylon trugodes]|uniref:heterokaryon incompatibility protein-domain-containing protein n=1 Tax=Hypoxylon trugodes TaxID=326681 RepID=UPI002194589C|nr:heterokaryon incompatibility protein-domain-containing protein [Hypoxylon trugodes]KAI1385897.1 heterokaryon incompatibility protein-domain-containing protein [Hypoxylon trugodes]
MDPNVTLPNSRFGPRLCEYCIGFFSWLERRGSRLDSFRYEHHPSTDSLKSASQSGCYLCAILEYVLRDRQNMKGTYNGMILRLLDFGISIMLCLGFKNSEKVFTIGFIVKAPAIDSNPPNTPLNRDTHYAPPISTGCSQAWELCRSWLDNCIRTHEKCKASQRAAWYPKRLLCIGGINNGDFNNDPRRVNIQLHETQEKTPTGPYMTLSHCWGDNINDMLRLGEDSYKKRLSDGFTYEELPQTFKDAVRLCRFLDCEYIWIDSLCIIQNSPNDWTHESRTMADVYQHSICNIAATASTGPTKGCFYPRNPIIVAPMEITLRMRIEGRRPSPKKYTFFIGSKWNTNVEEAPLNTRAWVLQERILAPRQIHCGREQLLWECPQLTACEAFPFAMETQELPHFEDPKMESPLKLSSKLQELVFELEKTPSHHNGAALETRIARLKDDLHQTWPSIVKTYSSRHLTNKSDRLVALYGVACRIQNVLKDEYVAGLWRSQLPWQLLWQARERGGSTLYNIGPSWSWASLDGMIYWKVPGLNWGVQSDIMLDILDVHNGHTTTDTSGRKESRLALRCFLYKLHGPKGKYTHISLRTHQLSNTEHIALEFHCTWDLRFDVTDDVLDSLILPDQVYAVPVLSGSHGCVDGLFVGPCREKEKVGFYRRVGTWWCIEERTVQHMRSAADKDKEAITLI